MTLSIALCTYNGERFLKHQLDSIWAQTRLPDELVVCDDCSSDSTLEILKEFSSRALFPVHIYQNERNLGSTKNFEKSIELCSGDTIALCDQDDVWRSQKLARTESVLEENPEVGLVFTDATLVGEGDRVLPHSLWDAVKFTRRRQKLVSQGRALEVLVRGNIVTGATMAFRSRLREKFMPIPENWVHDAWIALAIATMARVEIIREPLIDYRQHLSQQIGAPNKCILEEVKNSAKLGREDFQREGEMYRIAVRHLEKIDSLGLSKALELLQQKVDHLCSVRGQLPENRLGRLRIISKELLSGRYHKYSCGILSAAKDLLI